MFSLDVFFDFFRTAPNETPTFETENDRGGGMSDRPTSNGEGEEGEERRKKEKQKKKK